MANDGIPLLAHAGIPKKGLDIFQAAGCPVNEIFAFTATIDPAGNAYLGKFRGQFPVGIIKGERNLAIGLGLSGFRAVKDHILHLGSPQSFGALFAQHPAHRICDVALAAAVGADDGGNPALNIDLRFFCKRFESI
ncbi:hypothetical protein SDC9_147733 [bioreactor metagenome]|uniref:Uncharacterized protein n=1 Tax=bioreactor metagenome TaxID=1076179 RepID=A0A645EEU9_9ZZZZ